MWKMNDIKTDNHRETDEIDGQRELLCSAKLLLHNGQLAVYDKKETEKIVSGLVSMVNELQNFAIWMTGCGYDFCQHDYFCKQRDKLLKA
jgi:hypothetical protein